MRIKKRFEYPKTNRDAWSYMVHRYNEMDTAISSDLEESKKGGTSPTCQKGCAHCCRQLVMAAPLEGMALLHFIQHEMDADKRQRVFDRTNLWFAWRDKELPLHIPESGTRESNEASAHYDFGPHCPLLEDDVCTVYAVRPMSCRAHFVSSDPRGCLPTQDPLYMPGIWSQMDDIGKSIYPITQRIRQKCLKFGVDAEKDGKLIPEWIKTLM